MVLVNNPNTNNCFTVLTYNIFAKSLGTNTIPWVMNVSPSIQSRIMETSTSTTPTTFQSWVETTLKPEYMTHFHKNFNSGNYASMRQFWGIPQCNSQHDIPSELKGLSFVDEDQVSYTKEGNVDTVVATTLRGVAKKSLPNDVFQDFFTEVISSEQNVYSWSVRGPRIFDTILGKPRATSSPPDIVALQEYDIHDVMANYRSNTDHETFAQAMAASGYDGVFCKGPLLGRDPPSGLGLFWKRSIFQPVTLNTDKKVEDNKDDSGNGVIMETLECNEKALDGAITNIDLKEQWHPVKKSSPSLKGDGNKHHERELMKAADRRNAVIARLVHRPSGRIICLCTSHLMTTSRDSSKTNRFPGEVRAGEIASIRQHVEESIGANNNGDDAIVWVGDMNTDASVGKSLFGGKIMATSPSKPNNRDEFVVFDTGFDSTTNQFCWGQNSLSLSDAFVDMHQWGDGVGEGKYCTSRNANRIEWIDYIFHDVDRLKVIDKSKLTTPAKMIPDETHPSDHLPVMATFEFK